MRFLVCGVLFVATCVWAGDPKHPKVHSFQSGDMEVIILFPPDVSDDDKPAEEKPAESPTKRDEPKPRAKHTGDWKNSLAIVRSLASGATVAAVVFVTRADPVAATLIGGIAGGWAGYWQRNNAGRLDWQASDGFFKVRSEKDGPMWMRFSKRAIFTGSYAVLLSLGYFATGHNPDLVSLGSALAIGSSILQGIALQTPWEAVNKTLRDRATAKDPERAWLYRRWSGLGTLMQSMLSVATHAMTVAGFTLGSWIAIPTAAAGYLTWALIGTDPEIKEKPGAQQTEQPAGHETCRAFHETFARK